VFVIVKVKLYEVGNVIVVLDNSALNVSRRRYESLQLEIRKVNYVRLEALRFIHSQRNY
jgi:hypothetical protein